MMPDRQATVTSGRKVLIGLVALTMLVSTISSPVSAHYHNHDECNEYDGSAYSSKCSNMGKSGDYNRRERRQTAQKVGVEITESAAKAVACSVVGRRTIVGGILCGTVTGLV